MIWGSPAREEEKFSETDGIHVKQMVTVRTKIRGTPSGLPRVLLGRASSRRAVFLLALGRRGVGESPHFGSSTCNSWLPRV